MGAEFDTRTIKVDSERNLRARYLDLVADAQYDYGHAGYTGTIAESSGLTISDREFTTEEEAEEYLSKTCEKWKNTIAVRIKGTDAWVLGGVYSS